MLVLSKTSHIFHLHLTIFKIPDKVFLKLFLQDQDQHPVVIPLTAGKVSTTLSSSTLQ